MDIEAIYPASRGYITEALQRRANERRATVAFIHELQHRPQVKSIGRDPRPKLAQLAFNGARFHLLLGRNARIQGHLDVCHDALLAPSCSGWTGEATGDGDAATRRLRGNGTSAA